MDNFIIADIEQESKSSQFNSFKKVYGVNKKRNIKQWLWGMITIATVILFLPWTQNITAKGKVTALRQEQRPQELNTIIPGRIL
jgi:hypothetical protein